MIALSIRQPWAWLIIHAGKDIENRTWHTPYRGRFLIHAAKGCTRDEWEQAYDFAKQIRPNLMMPTLAMLERGGMVGEAEIVGCVDDSHSPWFVGPYGFVILNPKPIQFRPFKGTLGFFYAAP